MNRSLSKASLVQALGSVLSVMAVFGTAQAIEIEHEKCFGVALEGQSDLKVG